MPILITGCAFSGLEDSAALIGDLGVPCGFQKVFGTSVRKHPVGLPGWRCEASSLAVPHVPYLNRSMVLVHQVRHPLSNIARLLGSRIFGEGSATLELTGGPVQDTRGTVGALGEWNSDASRAYRRYLEFYRPALVIENPVRAALRYWLLWNLELEFYAPSYAHSFTVQMESISHLTFRTPVVSSGRTPLPAGVEGLSAASPQYLAGTEIAVEDLPKCWELDFANDLARRLGYTM